MEVVPAVPDSVSIFSKKNKRDGGVLALSCYQESESSLSGLLHRFPFGSHSHLTQGKLGK